VAQHGQILNIPDAYADKRFNPEVDKATGYRTRSILAVPICDRRGRVMAVVEMLNKRQVSNAGIFGQEDERLVSAFASFMGISLERGSQMDDGDPGQVGERRILAIAVSNMLSAEEAGGLERPSMALSSERLAAFATLEVEMGDLSVVDCFKFLLGIFYDVGFVEAYQIQAGRLVQFILSAHSKCKKMGEWGAIGRAAQFLYWAIKSARLDDFLTKSEELAILLAILYPGSDEKISQRAAVAYQILYRNRPGQEVHRSQELIALLTADGQGILDGAPKAAKSEVVRNMANLVCGNAKDAHFAATEALSRLVSPKRIMNGMNQGHRIIFAQAVLRLAGLSRVLGGFGEAEAFAEDCKTFLPGLDKHGNEDAAGFGVRCQMVFMALFVRPLATAVVAAWPGFAPVLDGIGAVMNGWKEKLMTAEFRQIVTRRLGLLRPPISGPSL
jgi:hypothetical protein